MERTAMYAPVGSNCQLTINDEPVAQTTQLPL